MFPIKTKERRLRVLENRVLRRIFGPKTDEVTGERRKLHNEEINDLYSSRNSIRLIKSRRMKRGMQDVWGRGEMYTSFWRGKRRERTAWKTQA